jgi:hypothetical protein
MSTLVIYTTHIIRDTVEEFIRRGVYKDDIKTFYLFIINNPSIKLHLEGRNIRILYRPNVGYDFGAWKYGLENIDISAFDYFIFTNSSVYGPYLPEYFNRRWTEVFTSFIREDIGITGCTISHEYKYHIQSYLLCTNKQGLSIIRKYFRDYSSKSSVITDGELNITEEFIRAGLKPFTLLLSETKNPCYNLLTKYIEDSQLHTMFVKNQIEKENKRIYFPYARISLAKNRRFVIFYILNKINFNFIYFLSLLRIQTWNRNNSSTNFNLFIISPQPLTQVLPQDKHQTLFQEQTQVQYDDILNHRVFYIKDYQSFIYESLKREDCSCIIINSEFFPLVPRYIRLRFNWLQMIVDYLYPQKSHDDNFVFYANYEDIKEERNSRRVRLFNQPKNLVVI